MVNPIAKKRFEDQRNTYIAEDRKLRELGEKRKTEEKEREEFVKGLAEEMPMKMVTEPMSSVTAPGEGKLFEEIKDFAGIGDKKDEKWEQEFISGFKENEGIEVKEEKKPKTTNQKNIVINQRNDTIMAAYESGEKWLMSEGEDDFIKALINNFRSAMGKAVEDLAYAINDIAPWYKPAGNVLEKNTAGKINDMAEKQFGNAKEKTGDFGDSMIDLADMASEELGYMVFGPKAGSFISDLGQGFAKYQNLREQGYGKDEALFESSKDLARAIATENVGNKFWRNGKVDERLFGKNGIVDKAVDIEYNRANEIGSLKNEFYKELTPKQWSKYYKKIAETGRLNSPVGDTFVYQTGGKIIISERVYMGNGVHDYQVQKIYKIKGPNSSEIAKDAAKIMERTGNYYDGERILELRGFITRENG
ncbi:MAG: hypothetical protein IJO01_04660 [Oscillospiraceae bacterium]|nr:hypothetical protein [Oscillospiraceae bacterium]